MDPCPRFEIRRARSLRAGGRWRYRVVLIAENCEVLYVTEHLTSEAAAMTNIEAVKALAATADVTRAW